MREHRYRGLSKKHGHWVYGNLVKTAPDSKNERRYYIVADPVFIPAISFPAERFIEIIPETLGGYIGKEDKYDKDIYEGDIPKVSHDLDEKGYSLFYIDTYLDFTGYVVSWENIKGYSCITHIIEEDYSNVEIIGNIHENPELMEGINDKT